MSWRVAAISLGWAVDPESELGDNKHCGMWYKLTNIVPWIKRVSLRIISVMEGGSHFPWAVDPESESGDNKHCSMQYKLANIVLWIKRVSPRIISVMEGSSHFPGEVDPESESGDNKHHAVEGGGRVYGRVEDGA